jgi:IS1 family transposase
LQENKKLPMPNNLSTEKKTLIVSMLAEDSSIRAIERITGVHRDTVMRLGVRVGEACKTIMDTKMRGLSCKQIEVDEIWGYIGKKAKNVKPGERNTGIGDVWTFIALDAETKIIPSFVVGKRDSYHAQAFMADLAARLTRRIQISSDALGAYPDAVERAFGSAVDYGQVVKTYSVSHLGSFKEAASRYSPAEVILVEKKTIAGEPERCNITTSHVEKQNHTVRMHVRRLTRLTNAFSKKLENFEAAMGLHFAYYNFCKPHLAVRCTPAMAAGVEPSQWSVAELVERCGE